jgi:hypothetical protein
MEPAPLLILVVGSLLVLGGVVAVAIREWNTRIERRSVGPVRDAIEIVVPAVGALVIVIMVWQLV